MKKRKAQLTIFIIITILIIAAAALFFTLRGNLNLPGKPASPETSEIQNFVQECLDESLEEVVFRIGEYGGYYFPQKISTPVLEIPYYIKEGKNLMPSKEQIQEQISRGIERELFFCINNFASFPEYEITKGKMDIKTMIEPEKVLVEMNYPLTIIKGKSSSKIKKFNSEVPVRLGIVYDSILEFVNQSINTKGVCISCLLEVSNKNSLQSDFSDYNKKQIFL